MASDKEKDKETVIGPGTQIVGEVRGSASLLVRGRIEGRIELSDTLTVDAGGVVKADIEVGTAVVSGIVVGGIVATEAVRLLPKAKVVGNITAPRVAIEAGAAYRGRLEMGPVDVAQRAAARAAAATSVSAVTTASAAIKARPGAAPAPRRVVPVPARRAAKAPSPSWARRKARR